MKKKSIFIIMPIIIVLLGVMAVLITLMLSGRMNNKSTDNAEVVAQSMGERDYQQQILYFEEKLKQNDKDVESYLSLAEAYYQLGQIENAIKTLETGYEKTKDEKIKAKLDEYRSKLEKNEDNSKVKEDDSKNLRLNDSLFEILSSYTYKQYKEKYSILSEEPTSSGDVKARFNGLDPEFYYGNTDDYTALDSVTGKVLDEAYPYQIVSPGLDKIFSGASEGFDIETLRGVPGVTDARVSLNPETRKNVVEFRFKDCDIMIESDKDGNVADVNAWNKIVPDIDKTNNNQEFEFKGNLKDAETYTDVYGTTEIKVREGNDNTNGEVIAQTTTDNNIFSVRLPIGDYTFDINSSGYIRDFYNVHVAGEQTNERDIILSKAVATGKMRVVLTWGSVPRDLDGHLEGTSSDGKNVHVFYGRKRDTAANLDVDHIMGNGCETITINDINGTYNYFVNRYSFDGSIATSGAVVKVYTADGKVTTITPPVNVSPTLWNVFSLQNGTISGINGNH